MYTGDPDMPAANPWEASRKDCGPVISKKTRSNPGAIALAATPITRMSKGTGVSPEIVVSPVPVMPGWISLTGKTAGGLAQLVAAGAGAVVNIIPSSGSTSSELRMTRRGGANRALPTGPPPCRSDPTPETLRGRVAFRRRASTGRSGEGGELRLAELPVADQHVAERALVVEIGSEVELEGDRPAEPFRRKVLQELVDCQDTVPERQVRVPAPPGIVRQVDVQQAVAQPFPDS